MAALVLGAGLALPAAAAAPAGTAGPKKAPGGCPVEPKLTFQKQQYVDLGRAGGEPLVATHPSGRLLYSAHAGTTHFYTPGSGSGSATPFVENYNGQTYIWTSDDNGKTWTYRDRTLPPSGSPNSGFSDPEFAIDSKGDIYFSEINLANIATSASTDDGDTWTLQNLTGAVLTDRQWMEADRPGELYFVANAFGGGTGVPPNPGLGHYIAKSTDGGKTFTRNEADVEGGSGLGDIRVDKRTGTLYEGHHAGGTLSVAAFRDARKGDLKPTETVEVVSGVRLVSSFVALDIDSAGNVYLVWDHAGGGEFDPGIYYAYSTTEGRKWSSPIKLDDGKRTAIWPWVAAGDKGRVSFAWLEATERLPGNDAETVGEHGWQVVAAATTSGTACGKGTTPTISRAIATPKRMHTGTICQSGTVCQGTLTDRRLGDYISMDVDATGRLYVGYSDTASGGPVALPGFVRQDKGPALVAPGRGGSKKVSASTGMPPVEVSIAASPAGQSLAATGSGATLPLAAALLVLGGLLLRRRREFGDAA